MAEIVDMYQCRSPCIAEIVNLYLSVAIITTDGCVHDLLTQYVTIPQGLAGKLHMLSQEVFAACCWLDCSFAPVCLCRKCRRPNYYASSYYSSS